MNAITRPVRLGPPTAAIAEAEAEHAAMARNRQGRAPRVAMERGLPDLMGTSAYRLAGLKAREDRTKAALDAAQAVMNAARTKSAKDAARKPLKVAHAAYNRAVVAHREERQGEAAAPMVQRDTITLGEVTLREARVTMAGNRAQLVCALDRLLARRSITREQHAAGKRYRDAYEAAGRDAYPVGMGEAGGCAPSSGNRRIEEAVASSAKLDWMRTVLGKHGKNLVEHVVVHDLDVSAWAARQRTGQGGVMDAKYAMGMLTVALSVLAVVSKAK